AAGGRPPGAWRRKSGKDGPSRRFSGGEAKTLLPARLLQPYSNTQAPQNRKPNGLALSPRVPQQERTTLMTPSTQRGWSVLKVAFLSLVGAFALLLATTTVTAQKEGPKKAGPALAMPPGLVRAGFTRPGNPPDKIGDNGKIARVAWSKDYRGIGC